MQCGSLARPNEINKSGLSSVTYYETRRNILSLWYTVGSALWYVPFILFYLSLFAEDISIYKLI